MILTKIDKISKTVTKQFVCMKTTKRRNTILTGQNSTAPTAPYFRWWGRLWALLCPQAFSPKSCVKHLFVLINTNILLMAATDPCHAPTLLLLPLCEKSINYKYLSGMEHPTWLATSSIIKKKNIKTLWKTIIRKMWPTAVMHLVIPAAPTVGLFYWRHKKDNKFYCICYFKFSLVIVIMYKTT